MKLILYATPLLMAGLTACSASEDADTPNPPGTAAGDSGQEQTDAAPVRSTTATLQTADGQAAGTVTASESGGAIMISLNGDGLPPGQHGVHVHTVGSCDAPDFESAGGHWNPTDQQHGLKDPAGQHAGDMPNLEVGEDGRGTLEAMLQGGSFDGLLDEDGSAFIVHASADDQTTDPSGASGARIACGVFAAG